MFAKENFKIWELDLQPVYTLKLIHANKSKSDLIHDFLAKQKEYFFSQYKHPENDWGFNQQRLLHFHLNPSNKNFYNF